MKYWFKIHLYEGDLDFLNSRGVLRTDKVKKQTRDKANKIADILSTKTGFSPLDPYWTTKSTFGWIFCDFTPERGGSALIGSGAKKLSSILKEEYKYIILSRNLEENVLESGELENKILIINLFFFKEFIRTFSDPSKRVELFLYRLPEEQLTIIKRWMRGRPESLKAEDKKPLSSDIMNVIKGNREFFRSKINTLQLLNLIKSYQIIETHEEMKNDLSSFKKMIEDDKTTEIEINKFLVERPWIISFDYASFEEYKKDKDFDIHLVKKKFSLGKDVLVELKTPKKKTTSKYSTHEVISAETAKAISQCINYLEENKELFDKGVVIIGREYKDAIYKMNKYLHNIDLLTYDFIYEKADKILNFLEKKYLGKETQLEEIEKEQTVESSKSGGEKNETTKQ